MALRARKISGAFEKQTQGSNITRIMVRQKTDENILDEDLLVPLMHRDPRSDLISVILIQIIPKERNQILCPHKLYLQENGDIIWYNKLIGYELTTVEPPVSDRPKYQVHVVAYESLDHIGSNFCLFSIW